ncbi:MAG: 50S ribosomal protein L21 [Holosporales bacterium]|jgi:large subunit ribosomal protein L21|nr:50S ribosomal protein L21 [Holosporales bacterium]
MFAVIKSGGKQYRVKPGDCIKVEKLDNSPSQVLALSDVLLISDDKGVTTIGSPSVSGASVNVEILKHVRNDKIIVFKKRRRHNSRRKNGHRQPMTVLKILDISLSKGA